jgi:hypothetical protein
LFLSFTTALGIPDPLDKILRQFNTNTYAYVFINESSNAV